MASTSNTFSDIAALSAKEYYERRSLEESEIKNGLLNYGVKSSIPEHESKAIHWHIWDKFALAADVAETAEPSAIAANASEIDATLTEFASYISIPIFGDKVRMKSLIEESYDKFREQASRTANARIMDSLVLGDNSVAGNDFDPFTKRYCGGAGSFADLTSAAHAFNSKDMQRAVAYVEQNNPAQGAPICVMDRFVKEQVLVNDQEFRDLIKFRKIDAFEKNEVTFWAGADIDFQADPQREALSSLGGALGTYSTTGEVFTTFIFHPKAFGTVQLMGKGGLKPKFHVQNISVTGATMTIGYRIPFKAAVLHSTWGVQLRSVCVGSSAIASVTRT